MSIHKIKMQIYIKNKQFKCAISSHGGCIITVYFQMQNGGCVVHCRGCHQDGRSCSSLERDKIRGGSDTVCVCGRDHWTPRSVSSTSRQSLCSLCAADAQRTQRPWVTDQDMAFRLYLCLSEKGFVYFQVKRVDRNFQIKRKGKKRRVELARGQKCGRIFQDSATLFVT